MRAPLRAKKGWCLVFATSMFDSTFWPLWVLGGLFIIATIVLTAPQPNKNDPKEIDRQIRERKRELKILQARRIAAEAEAEADAEFEDEKPSKKKKAIPDAEDEDDD